MSLDNIPRACNAVEISSKLLSESTEQELSNVLTSHRERFGGTAGPGCLKSGSPQRPMSEIIDAISREDRGVDLMTPYIEGDSEKKEKEKEKEATPVTFYQKLLSQKNAPLYLTLSEPYITHGYRPRLTVLGCLRSLFTIHNETFNIWSHLLGSLYMYYLTKNRWKSSATAHAGLRRLPPLLVGTTGTILFGTSAFAHTMCCHGKRTCSTCFAVDKSLIAFFLCGCALSSSLVMFRRPTQMLTRNIFMSVAMSTSTVGALQISDLFGESSKTFKVIILSALAATGLIPPLIEFAITRRSDVRHLIATRASLACILSIVGATCYTKYFPEKYWPDKFNYIGSSHGIMHVLVLCSAHVAFHGFSDAAKMLL